jgi:hypothetical protein
MKDPPEEKTGAISGHRPGTFVPGLDSRRGRGLKGRSGRLPDDFKAALRGLVCRSDVIGHLERILCSTTTSDSDFLAAYRYVTDRAYGKAPQTIEGAEERKPLTIRLVREWPTR